jgi:zinc transport system substrate-binding protein
MRIFAVATVAFLMGSSLALAELKVAVSIKPIHSLVASVMEGVGTPSLIVDGSNSPHTYNMKPSDAAMLEQSQVIFWVGHELEAFLEKPIEALGENSKTISLIDAKGIAKLDVREDANFPAEEEAEGEGESEHHHHDGADAHIWLDPVNAEAIVLQVAETLSNVDAANASAYKLNAEKTIAKLQALSTSLKATLAPAKGKSFIVFHDAYQYFENRFELKASGAISINPENPPGAKQIATLQKRIQEQKINCVFAEPQFDNKLVNLVLENSSAKAATLDPLGVDIAAGPELYEVLMRNLAQNLATCLAS